MSAPSSSQSQSRSAPGGAALYVVSTPIGNLGDITYRAVETLKSVGLIVAEDTRHSRSLLTRYEITTPVSAYHEHNEAAEAPRLVRRMLAGASVALISDAGTPLLSDPGARLVRAAVTAEITVIPIPGASALLAAVVASAIAADHFTFVGFLPRRGGDRERLLGLIRSSPFATVLYESPQRVAATLDDLIAAGCGDRDAAICRELTKRYEEIRRGTVAELRAGLSESARGEFVLVVAGGVELRLSDEEVQKLATELRRSGLSPRNVVEQLTVRLAIPRNTAYRLAHGSAGASETD